MSEGLSNPLNSKPLKRALANADMQAQRAHVWQTLRRWLTINATNAEPAFTFWHSEINTFESTAEVAPLHEELPFPGLPANTQPSHLSSLQPRRQRLSSLPGGPLITYIHYNPATHFHIRGHQLHRRQTLDAMLGAAANADQSELVPPLPPDAAVVMTAWWPVSGEQPSAMPVWDPELQSRSRGANGYLSWPTVVAVAANTPQKVPHLAFAGRSIENPQVVPIKDFYHLKLSAVFADQLMSNSRFRRAAIIALGRPLTTGDYIALVGLHLMTAELENGVWGTLWWHTQPNQSQFASGRPGDLPAPWDHYLLDVTFDAIQPTEADGTPNICFNPWFDATFSDTGGGSGVQANCISCHVRAAYPIRAPMQVTRGDPEPANGQQISTRLLWSIAKPGRTASQPQSLKPAPINTLE